MKGLDGLNIDCIARAQSTVAVEINHSVENIHQIAGETGEHCQQTLQTLQTSRLVESLAQQLDSQVGRFVNE